MKELSIRQKLLRLAESAEELAQRIRSRQVRLSDTETIHAFIDGHPVHAVAVVIRVAELEESITMTQGEDLRRLFSQDCPMEGGGVGTNKEVLDKDGKLSGELDRLASSLRKAVQEREWKGSV